ncbi:universal stress protein, partial [bacterium]|nr:universal stress protein [bacterium]
MNDEPQRPSPDELLRAIGSAAEGRGHLRVFIGMAAGVGKTYAMLQSAHRLQKKGTRVLVGVVETHGRKDTEALLKGLQILPQAEIE